MHKSAVDTYIEPNAELCRINNDLKNKWKMHDKVVSIYGREILSKVKDDKYFQIHLS